MDLLERIAASNGDPQKTIEALRLINQRLKQDLARVTAQIALNQAAPRINLNSDRDKPQNQLSDRH